MTSYLGYSVMMNEHLSRWNFRTSWTWASFVFLGQGFLRPLPVPFRSGDKDLLGIARRALCDRGYREAVAVKAGAEASFSFPPIFFGWRFNSWTRAYRRTDMLVCVYSLRPSSSDHSSAISCHAASRLLHPALHCSLMSIAVFVVLACEG